MGLFSLSRTSTLVVAVLPLLAASGAHAQGGLTFPAPGVVCDTVGRSCFDSSGPSAVLTQQQFGERAADRVARNAARADSRDFRLSTGQTCILAKRTCYDDGWNQTNVAVKLTQRLFGTSGGGTAISGDTSGGDKPVVRDTGFCTLSRGGLSVFDGSCNLKQVVREGQNTFVVTLRGGSRYVFRQAGSGYAVTDDSGRTWPATFVDRGRSGVFRFGDYKLVATQNTSAGGLAPDSSGRPSGANPASGGTMNKQEATGEALGNLLKAIFSRP
jgi:hypothetical protein